MIARAILSLGGAIGARGLAIFPRAAVAVLSGAIGARGLATFPRAAAAVTVIRTRADSVHEFLLVKRAKPPRAGSWSIPGGKIELGEPTLLAAARELMEETGLGPADGVEFYPWAIATSDVITRDTHGKIAFHFVITQLLAFVRADATATAGDDACGVEWVTLASVDDGSRELGGNVAAVFRRADALIRSGSVTRADAIVIDSTSGNVPDFLVER